MADTSGFPGDVPTRIAPRPPASRLNVSAIIVFVVFCVALVATTVFVMNRQLVTQEAVWAILSINLICLAIILYMIFRRIRSLLRAGRESATGVKMHLRITAIFSIIALAPTIIVAAFATLSVSVGIETWFSTQVGSVVRNSLITAQAYANEHRRTIELEVLNMASDLNRAGAIGISDPALAELLRRQQRLRRFPEAYLIDGGRSILHRGEFSYSFTYDPPSDADMAAARVGDVVILEDQENNELRALVYLTNYIDTFLYVTRQVDGNILLLLDETADTVALYNQTEATRGSLLSVFALIYLEFAVLVLTVAAWFGLWMAERLSRPIGALASAAVRVGDGDLDAKVPEEKSGDEVALLSRVFNRMTAQVKSQRDALLEAKTESEERRNFIEAVLTGVSAGVIGLDRNGDVEMANAAARRMLGQGVASPKLSPALASIYKQAKSSISGAAQGQVSFPVGGEDKEFLVRVEARSAGRHEQGFVMTIDDLTALVSAQREAAWGDVARRIAHEIKNPLTPIQLSAERLRRKFAPEDEDARDSFNQYADVIVRHTGDIRRMVDEFSKFARMPQPEPKRVDAAKLLNDAVQTQRVANPDVAFEVEGAEDALWTMCDEGMINQALTNVLKNAAEAVAARIELAKEPPGAVRARLVATERFVRFEIEDNGVGLPKGSKAQLLEPYVTTRAKGTGLGLAIVKKIAEQHGGEVTLEQIDEGAAESGARVTMTILRKDLAQGGIGAATEGIQGA